MAAGINSRGKPRPTITCERCGEDAFKRTPRQRFCGACSAVTAASRKQESFRRWKAAKLDEANAKQRERRRATNAARPRLLPTMTCQECGKECVRTASRQKSCTHCRHVFEHKSSVLKAKRYRERGGRAAAARYQRRKREDPLHRMRMNISRGIRYSLRASKAGHSWEKIVGYTVGELAEHLERQFTNGMTWLNYGAWEIDHILPVASFEITSIECPGFKACWAITNLRPLWKKDNKAKSAKRLLLL